MRLATDAETAGDHSAAVRWRRRLVEADPISSRSALALMRALVAAGDRTAALQHARIYEALVHQELESEPDPSIAKYAATLRAGGDEGASVSVPSSAGASGRVSSDVHPVGEAHRGSKRRPSCRSPRHRSPSDRSIELSPVDEATVEEATAGRRNYWWPAGIFLAATILL